MTLPTWMCTTNESINNTWKKKKKNLKDYCAYRLLPKR